MSSLGSSCCAACGAAESSCGCCEGVRVRTPQAVDNRPGLAALRYRVGTHAAFLSSMRAALSQHAFRSSASAAVSVSECRPLAALATRDPSDPSLALLDATAVLADVLSFYQERIANEGFLRTAAERRSVLELARLVGYRLKPGVAASTYLAYTLDDNAKDEVLIPKGSKAQTVPGPGETQQTFETSEDLRARANWNRLRPRLSRPQTPDDVSEAHELYLAGISTQLKPGDPLLVRGGQLGTALFRVREAASDAVQQRTRVSLEPWITASTPTPGGAVFAGLIAAAPSGKLASGVKASLQRVRAAQARDGDDAARVLARSETLPLVQEAVARLQSLPAPKVRPWLSKVQARLQQLTAANTERVAMHAAAFEKQEEGGFAGQLSKLATPASKPLGNALLLQRNLARSFTKTSDAGLRVTAATAPELRTAAVTTLATDSGVTPSSELEVYALRLKTGLFGRTFPKQTLTRDVVVRHQEDDGGTTETTTRSTDTDEWKVTVGDEPWRSEQPRLVNLDGAHEGVLPAQWIVLDFGSIPTGDNAPDFKLPGAPLLIAKVGSVAAKVARAEYGASGDTTRIELADGAQWIEPNDEGGGDEDETSNTRNFRIVRNTAVYTQSERLELAPMPIADDVCQSHDDSTFLELDELYAELEPGRFVIVQGERADIDNVRGVMAAEALMITDVVHDVRAADTAIPQSTVPMQSDGESHYVPPPLAGDRNHTFVRTEKPLSYCYYRDSLTIYANVVRATHGETRRETLGSGDGSKSWQAFTLKQTPLTYLAAPTAVGAQSTLDVFVNDVRWHERDSLFEAGPDEHVFVSRADDDAVTRVTFGDGREGARLPTGAANVTAVYRNGIGRVGNARADQISLLGTRPLGVREVRNPLRASGGADRETRDQARKSVPISVRALDRLVSVRDYADFAHTFAGIAKADALELSDGRRSVVHVTIAGADDIPIDPGSDLFTNLARALRDLGDPSQPLRLAARELLLLVVSAGIRIDPDYVWENVVAQVRARVLDRFGFEARELAQRTYASELLGVMQAVPGVVYIDLDVFGAIRTSELDAVSGILRPRTPEEIAFDVAHITSSASADFVDAARARRQGDDLLPAQLAMFSSDVPDTLVLNQIR